MSWLRWLPWRRRVEHNGHSAREAKRAEERKLAATRRRWADTHRSTDVLAAWIDDALGGGPR